MAFNAFMEEPAGVEGHLLQCRVATLGTRQGGFQDRRSSRHYFFTPP
jgi:hypothetical protein